MNKYLRQFQKLVYKDRLYREIYKNILFFFRTSAPLKVYVLYFITLIRDKVNKNQYKKIIDDSHAKLIVLGTFTRDWISPSAPYLHRVFKKYEMFNKSLNILEIGSWEGISSLFMLTVLPNSRITAVDTWEGGDEHAGWETLSKIEINFDSNLKKYSDRITKFKGTSYSFFQTCEKSRNQFDLIYIDGSHYVDDVICDAIKSFEQLKIGGILIFDDYIWGHYKNPIDNPAGAINSFLKLKAGSYELLSVGNEIIIKKTRDRYQN